MNLIYRFLPLLLCGVISAPAQAQGALPADKVIASNQYVTVTYADFEAELARIPESEQYSFLLDRTRLARMVDNVLLNKTLAMEARKNGLESLPKVQAEIRNQTEKVLAKFRGQQFQSEVAKIDLAARAREAFLTNPQRFITPERHDTWHILVAIKDRSREQAQARAEEIRARILAGESIDKLAETMSDDPTAKQNWGHLGNSPLSTFVEPFGVAVRKLKVGEVSPVFETNYGFHVAKLLGHTPARKEPYEYFKQQLMQEAETQYLLGQWDQHLQALLKDPKLFVDIDALEAIRPKVPKVPPLTQDAAPKK